MSYDVWFLRGPAPTDGDWTPLVDVCMDEPLRPELEASLPAILGRLRRQAPGWIEHGPVGSLSFLDRGSGLELSFDRDRGTVTLTSWGIDRSTHEERLAAIDPAVAIVVEETGLVAYDPQTDDGWGRRS